MPFEDKSIVCSDCGQEFIHSGADQERYAQRGFEHEPKRCRPCREKRKSQPSNRPGPSAADHRPHREFFDAQCADCGAQTKVPFKPVEGRPVYCRDCYRAHKG